MQVLCPSSNLFCISACSSTLPMLMNGMLTSGETGGPYFSGAMLAYMCETNFDSTDNPLLCMCNTVGATPMWNCGGVDFDTTCQRREYHSNVWLNIDPVATH